MTGQALLDLSNGAMSPPPSDPQNLGHVQASHLSAMIGLVEIPRGTDGHAQRDNR